jgi:hypothetical protein
VIAPVLILVSEANHCKLAIPATFESIDPCDIGLSLGPTVDAPQFSPKFFYHNRSSISPADTVFE